MWIACDGACMMTATIETCMMVFIVLIRDPFLLLRLFLTPGGTFSSSLSFFPFSFLFDRECSTVINQLLENEELK